MATPEVTRDLSDKKTKALTTAITQIERSHGKGAVVAAGAPACLRLIGSWTAGHRAPPGFASLEEAVNWSSREHSTDSVTVTWR